MKAIDSGLIAASARTLQACGLYRPTSTSEAIRVLIDADPAPTLVAGGTDLCAQINEGLAPTSLLALDCVAELRRIEADADELRIGSGVTHHQGSTDPAIMDRLPGFARAWACIANARIRFRATIGGNLMARRPRYEMSVLLSALEARLRFRSADGVIERDPQALWTEGPPERALLDHVSIPVRHRRTLVYNRSLRPIMTLALATNEDGGRRAAVATEWLPPAVLPLAATEGDPARAAVAAFQHLPETFCDVVSSRWYLQRAGTALLARQLREGSHG